MYETAHALEEGLGSEPTHVCVFLYIDLMHARVHVVYMYVCMHVCMYMYVCMYIHVCNFMFLIPAQSKSEQLSCSVSHLRPHKKQSIKKLRARINKHECTILISE